MKKESVAYAEHVVDLFTEIMHKTIIVQPLREIGAEITPSLAQTLQFLSQRKTCPVRDIALGLAVTDSAASQLIDRLVRKGFVTRSENERDRRLSEIRLTEDGRKLVERIKLRRIMGMSRILKRLDPERRKSLVENLESFIAAAIDSEESALETCSHCGREHLPECVINEVYRATAGVPIRQA